MSSVLARKTVAAAEELAAEGRYTEASELFARALELAQEDAEIWLAWSKFLLARDRWVEAKLAWRRALALDQDANRDLDEEESELAPVLRKHEAALAGSQPSRGSSCSDLPDAVADRVAEARDLSATGLYEAAEFAYRDLLQDVPDLIEGWRELAALLERNLDPPEAAEGAYFKWLGLDADNGEAWYRLAQCSVDIANRQDHALAAIDIAIDGDPANETYLACKGDILWVGMCDRTSAIRFFSDVVEAHPHFGQIWISLGHLYADYLDSPYNAIETYRKAIDLDPGNTAAWMALAHQLADLPDKAEEAAAACQRAIDLQSDDPDVLRSLANFLWHHLRRPDEAEAYFRRALELVEPDPQAWYGFGEFLAAQSGREQEAEAAFRTAAETGPAFPAAWRKLGWLLCFQGRAEEAIACYRLSVAKADRPAAVLSRKARSLDRQGADTDVVETLYRDALAADPGDAFSHCHFGYFLHRRRGDGEGAAEHLVRAVRIEPEKEGHWYRLAGVFEKLGRLREAEDLLRRTIAEQPSNMVAYGFLADVLWRQDDRTDDPEPYLARSLEIGAHDCWCWDHAGWLYEREGRKDEAVAAYRKSLALVNHRSWTVNRLGYLLIEHCRNYTAAVVHFQSALRAEPGNAWGWLQLGLARWRGEDDLAEAETCFREALRLVPSYKSAADLLTQVQARIAEEEAV